MKKESFCRTRRMVKFIINGVIAALLLVMIFSFKYPNLPKVIVYKVFREYARISMTWQTRNWQELAGEKFILRYQPADENVARLVLETAEESYSSVNHALKFSSEKRVPIILYPNTLALNRSFGWAADESAMGVYWAGVIRVLSPNYWIQDEDKDEIFRSEGPMSHEYAHFIVDYIAGGNCPRWFTEGIAQRVERKITGFEMALTGPEEIYDLAQMDENFDLLPNQSAAYRQSMGMVDFLANEYGEDAILQILQALGKGESLNRSFIGSIGVDLNGFKEKYLQSLSVN